MSLAAHVRTSVARALSALAGRGALGDGVDLGAARFSVERAKRVYDVETHIPADVDAFPAGYISADDDVIVGLQTDVPLKRPMMPAGGWRNDQRLTVEESVRSFTVNAAYASFDHFA